MTRSFSALVLSSLILMLSVSCVRRKTALDTFLEQHPVNTKDVKLPVPSKRTMTILLGGNNKVLYYLGDQDKPVAGPAATGYGKDSLGKAIQQMMAKAQKDTSTNNLVILIKSSNKSTYKNFVGAIDLINECGVQSYGIVDIAPSDVDLLKKAHIY
ncbi:MAG TPA: hypothetical protein VHS53_17745 [Mucilaginibacter sp.]|nr:hypothetical protein [Mucilaginibacter sp.]